MPADTLLFLTQVAPYLDGPAGVHGVLQQATVGAVQIAELHGLRGQPVADVRDLDDDDLTSARALALFTIGETPWSGFQRAVVLDRVRSGHLALVAIHSATDACYAWDEYGAVVGARFDGHPWTQEVALDVMEATHPATRHLPARWRWYDEVYQFRDLRPDARLLLRVPEEQLDPNAPGAKRPPFGYPLSWCFAEGAGRVFSTSLGHFPGAWESPAYLQHLAGGLSWALGEGV
jgi:type 1 glutamine amidotransferase